MTKTESKTERILVTLSSGLVGVREDQVRVVKALGLKKFGSAAIHCDSPTIKGMVNKVRHLITVEKFDQ